MWIKTRLHQNLKCWIECRLHRHLKKHWHGKIHKAIHYARDFYHHWTHLGELILVSFMWFLTFIFASGAGLPNNTSFVYPLQKVSTLECRILYREDMPDNCKIDLPIIYGANYDKYKWSPGYRDIYTTLWAAPYSDSRNQDFWAHAGVDVATARGTPLYSIWNWKVYFAWWNSAYGNVVKIKYLYKWEYIYATYAHMDTIEIEQWQIVNKWQRIWTVWNSGNVFGALWWYHVHFEISKDIWWRPKYSYLNCPDLKKWHYQIIQQWLCREQLFANEYDPIRLIEWIDWLPSLVNNSWSNDIIENIIPVGVATGVLVDNIETGSVNTGSVSTGSVQLIEENVNLIVDQEIKLENLILDTSVLDQYSQHFWNQNSVSIETDLSGRNLKIWEEWLIIININKRNPVEKYNWIMNIPFVLMSTNTNVSLSLTNIKLVNDGKVEVKVKWDKIWTSTVLINFGWKRIWKFSLSIGN